MRRSVLALLVLAAAGVGLGRASLYQPDDLLLTLDGRKLPYDEFRRRLGVVSNVADPRPVNGGPNPDRQKVLDRVRANQLVRAASADADAVLAADEVRLGNSDAGAFVTDALNRLAPRTRDRRPNYFVHTTLAHAHAARGEWAEAATYHGAALLDCELPAKVKGWSDGQRAWVARLDAEVLPYYLNIRQAEAGGRPDVETEGPTPLFPVPAAGGKAADPVRWVNEAGEYEPGALAAAERAKLPADAVAVVQQLLLWFPSDTRLYWLLAELYAADGEFGPARAILDECVWSRQYGNRAVLMAHRAAVTAAADARPPEPESPVSLRMIAVYFGVVGVLVVFAALRAVLRRH